MSIIRVLLVGMLLAAVSAPQTKTERTLLQSDVEAAADRENLARKLAEVQAALDKADKERRQLADVVRIQNARELARADAVSIGFEDTKTAIRKTEEAKKATEDAEARTEARAAAAARTQFWNNIATQIGTILTLLLVAAIKMGKDKLRYDRDKAEAKERRDRLEAEAAKLKAEVSAVKRDVKVSAETSHAENKQIHSLVNSTLSAALKEVLEGLRLNLGLMLESAESQKQMGILPSAEILAQIDATRTRIGELTADLKRRDEETKSAAVQLSADMQQVRKEEAGSPKE